MNQRQSGEIGRELQGLRGDHPSGGARAGTSDPRERSALGGLALFHRLRTAQLQELIFAGRPETTRSRVVITSRTLRRLGARGLIAVCARAAAGPRGGGAERIYRLTERGASYLARLDPALAERRCASRDRGSIEHDLLTADIYLALARAARMHPGHSVSEWHPDQEAVELLGSSRVVPDGHVLYTTAAWELDAFVEADLGTERPVRFARKVAAYVAVLRGGTWRAHLASWPVVLTVTPSAARAAALRSTTETLLRAERDAERLIDVAQFFFAGLGDLYDLGPLAAIWEVSGRAGCHGLLPRDPPDDGCGDTDGDADTPAHADR